VSDPFLITGPAVISFSGGRTSGYMLWRILQAHGGSLPDDVVPLFTNTGREMPATLDFVRDCAAAWSVPIAWAEYRWAPGGPSFQPVTHGSASRNGEPFEMLLQAKSMLPNPVARFCTIEMKIRTMKRWVISDRGWKRWKNVVGLRADEPGRVGKATDPARNKKDRWDVLCPLAEAGVDKAEVLAFWRGQTFDLRVAGEHEGNCDGCFLKSRRALGQMLRAHPERMRWWEDQEAKDRGPGAGATFRSDRTYAGLRRYVETNDSLAALARGEVFDDQTGCEISCTD
jgi:3'-phosphoadenosine 5'-phosphosulfate sulfotransferase (PAPS reductase)/FAD synthetase